MKKISSFFRPLPKGRKMKSNTMVDRVCTFRKIQQLTVQENREKKIKLAISNALRKFDKYQVLNMSTCKLLRCKVLKVSSVSLHARNKAKILHPWAMRFACKDLLRCGKQVACFETRTAHHLSYLHAYHIASEATGSCQAWQSPSRRRTLA